VGGGRGGCYPDRRRRHDRHEQKTEAEGRAGRWRDAADWQEQVMASVICVALFVAFTAAMCTPDGIV
jgi:hypothetical protein